MTGVDVFEPSKEKIALCNCGLQAGDGLEEVDNQAVNDRLPKGQRCVIADQNNLNLPSLCTGMMSQEDHN